MSIRSKATAALIFLALLVSPVAHADGIFNPSSNNVGDFQGIDSNAASSVAPSFLRQVATRTIIPNTINNTLFWKQNRRQHIASVAITSLQAVFADFFVNSNTAGFTQFIEAGPGAATSITASVEYPAGTFTQIKFSASATGSIPNNSMLVSDAVAISIPKGASFYINQWEHNTGGILYTTYGVSPFFTGDFFQFGSTALTDQTMTGISSSTSPGVFVLSSAVALIAQTTAKSVLIIADSRGQGVNDVPDAALDVGELARSIGPSAAYINAGISGDFAQGFLTSNANRVALGAYVSEIYIQLGVNDFFNFTRSSSQLVADRASIAALYPGKPAYQTTIMDETGSSDGWTSATQTQNNASANTIRIAFNSTVRAGATGFTGFADLTSVTETALASGLWNFPGWTTDGVHQTQFGNIAIKTAGVVPF